jgi:hypothetical protein
VRIIWRRHDPSALTTPDDIQLHGGGSLEQPAPRYRADNHDAWI